MRAAQCNDCGEIIEGVNLGDLLDKGVRHQKSEHFVDFWDRVFIESYSDVRAKPEEKLTA